MHLLEWYVLIMKLVEWKKENLYLKKKVNQIIKPRCMYIGEDSFAIHKISQQDAEEKGIDPEIVVNEFKNDIKKVQYIVSHNVEFHLNTVIAEATRYNIMIDFNKYVIIDTMSWKDNDSYIKLKTLCKKFYTKDEINKLNNLELIKNIFFKQYNEHLTLVKGT